RRCARRLSLCRVGARRAGRITMLGEAGMFLVKERIATPRLSALNELRGISARRTLAVPPTFEHLLVMHDGLPGLADCAEPLKALLAQINEAVEASLARGRDFDEVWGLIRLRDAVGHLILDRVSEYAQDAILVADRVVRDLFQRFFNHPRVR